MSEKLVSFCTSFLLAPGGTLGADRWCSVDRVVDARERIPVKLRESVDRLGVVNLKTFLEKSLSNVHLEFGAVTRTRKDCVHASSFNILSISNTSTCSLMMNSRRRSSSMDESTLKMKSSSRRGALLIALLLFVP